MNKLIEELKGLRWDEVAQIVIECPSVRHKIHLKRILTKRIKHKGGNR